MWEEEVEKMQGSFGNLSHPFIANAQLYIVTNGKFTKE
jgi:hypothetical protein